MKRSISAAHALLASHRRFVTGAIYGGLAVVCLATAFLLRFELTWPSAYTRTFLAAAPILLAIRLGFAALFRVSSGRWRFVGTADVVRLAAATGSGTVVFFAVCTLLPLSPAVPRSVMLIEWVLTTYLTAAIWITYRRTYEELRRRRNGHAHPLTPVLIVGAGEAGNLLVREMVRSSTRYRAVGILDDDPAKWETALHGVPVRGPTRNIAAIAAETGAEEIVIAVPSAMPAELRAMVEACEATDIPFKVLPGIAEVLAGDVRLTHLRDLRIEDLLGREPVELEFPELAADLRGCAVLVTGAAGSIGSELTRQLALHRPRLLILLDQAESDLYYLDLELSERHPDVRRVSIVGDIVERETLKRVFRDYSPERVFHAAAYKHVPLMELNVREAIRNNVLGTWRVADAAGALGAQKFVLVSTDKAVRPTSVMGATKRLAEMIVLELQQKYPRTAFGAVRFGNVLGSKGSVIPTFKRQIEAGRPLSVTHPDATRYFMTIPEAVQLILKASLMPELCGNIAMLDMGEPVRILDLARNLLRLAGVSGPMAEHIVFTGLRPGEKLHEQLIASEEMALPTPVPKIRLIAPHAASNGTLSQILPTLSAGFREHSDAQLRAVLTEVFPEISEGAPGPIEKAYVPVAVPVEYHRPKLWRLSPSA